MGLAAGSDVRARPLAAGFTMVEMLLVIGMLVLILGVAGLWMGRGMFAVQERAPQEAFLAAAAQARVLAMQTGRPVLLAFDEEAQGFRLRLLDAQTPGGLETYGGELPWEADSRWRGGLSGARGAQAGSGAGAAIRGSGGVTGSGAWASAGAGGGYAANSLTGAGAGSGAGAGMGVNDGSGTGARGSGAGARDSGAGSGGSGSVAQRAADTRFFALPQGSRISVTFYLLYGDEPLPLRQPLDGIRYHPSGVSTPVEVRMEDRGGSDFRLTLLPDHLSAGLRLDEGGRQ